MIVFTFATLQRPKAPTHTMRETRQLFRHDLYDGRPTRPQALWPDGDFDRPSALHPFGYGFVILRRPNQPRV